MSTNTPSELSRLRAVAYGRASNADEERAAVDALQRLRELEAATAAGSFDASGSDTAPSTSSGNATVAVPVEALAAKDAALRQAQGTTSFAFDEPLEAPTTRRPLFWVAIAAVLVLCFGAGFATASALKKVPSAEPGQSLEPTAEPELPQLSDAEKVEAGKRVSAAIAVLLAPLSEADRAIPRYVILSLELNPNTTHPLTEPGTYPRMFGAKNLADDICLVWDEGEGGWGSSCMPTEEFGINGGITTGVNDVVYSWDGTTATSHPLEQGRVTP